MDERLLRAAQTGDCDLMKTLHRGDKTVLDGKTTQQNTCLHIAALCGQENFCSEVVSLHPSLLSAINSDQETPLLTAVKTNRSSAATVLLQKYLENNLNGDLEKRDSHGCNVLHHAIRSGLKELALDLIDKSPAAVLHTANRKGESPIFMAVLRRDFENVCIRLLGELPGSVVTDDVKYSGTFDSNALHAAVKYDQINFANLLVATKQPDLVRALARKHDNKNDTPMQLAAHFGRFEILDTMLQFDQSLGYHGREAVPLLFTAASRGHVEFARKLLEYCPDAPYVDVHAKTCLHEAVLKNRMKFVEFILEEPKLSKLINMQDNDGNTALHVAVQECNMKMVGALLRNSHIDISVVNNDNCAPIWKLNKLNNDVKTMNWTKISHLISAADERAKTDIHNLHEEIKNDVDSASRKDAKSLSQTYTGNTSLVAILIATVTFAAAFTLPGGYSSSAGSEGLAIMARKLAFQAFLIFDTLAMCCSLAVAFLLIKIRSMDFEYLVHYKSFTTKLMWFAYMATALAFATGLYTVVAPRLHWLAITVCVLSVLLPIKMVFMGEWPVLQTKFRRGKFLDSKFLDMV